MVTRLKIGSLPPLRVFINNLKNQELMEPKNVVEALSKPNWFQAMKDEFLALLKNRTWELVP